VDLEAAARRAGIPLRILVTRLRYLGDVILTTPALAALAKRYPGAEIHYLAEAPYVPVLEGNPHLAGVIPLRPGLAGSLGAVAAIRKLRFSAAIDLFYNPRSAALLFLSGVPVRVGGSRRIRRRLYTHVAAPPPGVRSAVAHHVAFLRAIGVEGEETLPRVYLGAAEIEEGRAAIARALGRGERRPVIAFHPGGTWPAKRWAAESFGRLAVAARAELGAAVVAVAGPGEEGIAREAAAASEGALTPLPPMPIRLAASALAACAAVVANDGGVMHLSVALGRPTVAVFGPTETGIWFPYEGAGPFAVVTSATPCAPCHRHVCDGGECLKSIEPAEVLGRLREVLAWRS
jgi:lipopolysaccharide heptosyltransferase II